MFTRLRFAFALVLITGAASHDTAVAQPPKAIDFKLGNITLRLTNLQVVTGERPTGPEGGLPDKTVPLTPDKLLAPDDMVWITFDYETNFMKSGEPKGPDFLSVGIEIPETRMWGYQPAGITKKSGKGAVGLVVHPGTKAFDVNEAVKLTTYMRTKGEEIQSKSDKTVLIKCRIDGVVTLSATQYAEIQAMMRKVAELEKKVQALEGKKLP